MVRNVYGFCCCLLAATLCAAAQAPTHYAITETNQMFVDMVVQVERNGSLERIHKQWALAPGGARTHHSTSVYDFARHRVYLREHGMCSEATYTSAHAPAEFDPFARPVDASFYRHVTVKPTAVELHGRKALLYDSSMGRLWVDPKLKILVRQEESIGGHPRTLFDVTSIRLGGPQAPIRIPAGCEHVAGSANANGGHAGKSVTVTPPGH